MIRIVSIIVLYLFCADCLLLEICQNHRQERYMTLQRDLNEDGLHNVFLQRQSTASPGA